MQCKLLGEKYLVGACLRILSFFCAATCAARGEVLTWGWNEHGQLGVGSAVDSQLPQMVQGMRLVAGVSLGSGFGVAW